MHLFYNKLTVALLMMAVVMAVVEAQNNTSIPISTTTVKSAAHINLPLQSATLAISGLTILAGFASFLGYE
jgi:hypothetical protein